MENRINIAELLKDCPTGMELDSTLYYNVFFDKICEDDDCLYPIRCYTIEDGIRNSVDFTKYGEFHTLKTSKCVIFPKGKTTWEGFVPPFKFKDGDILFVEAIYDWIFIYKENENKENLYKHVATNFSELVYDDIPLCNREYVKEIRFATEEEKLKLFNAIKANGYKWNADTKTLEKATKLIFNNGDIVATISGAWIGITTGGVSREFMPTYCVINGNGKFEAYTDVKKAWCFSRLATKEERQKLFNEIKAHGYTWNSKTKTLEKLIQPQFKVGDKVRHKNNHNVVFTIISIEEDSYVCGTELALWFDDQDNYELVPNKFDIHTLTPLEPVLVRNTNGQVWTIDFFSHIIDTNKGLKPSIVCVGHCPNQCIPYKGNEFLRGTADECKDFYKTWES